VSSLVASPIFRVCNGFYVLVLFWFLVVGFEALKGGKTGMVVGFRAGEHDDRVRWATRVFRW
jgi:hypothetical protein